MLPSGSICSCPRSCQERGVYVGPTSELCGSVLPMDWQQTPHLWPAPIPTPCAHAGLHPDACSDQKPKELDPEVRAGTVGVGVCFPHFLGFAPSCHTEMRQPWPHSFPSHTSLIGGTCTVSAFPPSQGSWCYRRGEGCLSPQAAQWPDGVLTEALGAGTPYEIIFSIISTMHPLGLPVSPCNSKLFTDVFCLYSLSLSLLSLGPLWPSQSC